MGRRSRKRPGGAGTPARAGGHGRAHPGPASGDPDAVPPRRLRGAERDALARAELTALQPGERPVPLMIAAVTAALFAAGNLVLYAAGVEVQGEEPSLFGVVSFAAIMLVCAWGMWTRRYWAVLGFQALLAITIVIAALSLLVASNVLAVVLCVTILGLGGWLFWKLVRVLGRMKVPESPGTAARGRTGR